MVLQSVDKLLRMLQAHTDGEPLGLKLDARGGKRLIDIAGRMPRGEDYRTAVYVARGGGYAGHSVAISQQTFHACAEKHPSATSLYGVAHRLYHLREAVGADMRMGVDEYILARSMLPQHGEYLVDTAALFAAGVQFAVGVSARSSLAEAIVGVGVDNPLAGYAGHIAAPCIHILSAFEHHRPYAKLNETKSGKQTGRTGAHHYGLPGVGAYQTVDYRLGYGGRVWESVEIEAHAHIDHHLALAGVDAAPHYFQGLHPVGVHSGLPGRLGLQQRVGLSGYSGRDTHINILVHSL